MVSLQDELQRWEVAELRLST